MAIGEFVLDLSVLEDAGKFHLPEFQQRKVFADDSLNAFLSLGRPAWRKTREILQRFAQRRERRSCAMMRLCASARFTSKPK